MSEKPSAFEKISGSPVTELVATAGAAYAGASALVATGPLGVASVPLVALIPVLAKLPSALRHKERIDDTLAGIQSDMQDLGERLQHLTDSQYKLVSELLATVMQTVDEEKLNMLRKAVKGSVLDPKLAPDNAGTLSRILRDISADEVRFLTRSFSYDRIQVLDPQKGEGEREAGTLRVETGSREAMLVGGLTSLGLLEPGEPVWESSNLLRFSPYVAKLLALLGATADQNKHPS